MTTTHIIGLNRMLRAYATTALWSSTDDDGESFDGYSVDDIHPESLKTMREDCAAFLADNSADIGTEWERAGHDFWLTRNGAGAGFWDGDWEEAAGQRLTAAAHVYGERNLYWETPEGGYIMQWE